MNDRYLFKAKIKGATTGHEELDWAVGNLIVEQKTGRHFIVDLSHFSSTTTKFEDIVIEVDPSTICQCTGLKDKNGKLIWENDVCIIRDGTLDEEDGYFRLDWEVDRAMFEFEGTGLCVNFDNVFGDECEVIGNAIDNPELLEQ